MHLAERKLGKLKRKDAGLPFRKRRNGRLTKEPPSCGPNFQAEGKSYGSSCLDRSESPHSLGSQATPSAVLIADPDKDDYPKNQRGLMPVA